MVHSQVLPATVELVKLQLHRQAEYKACPICGSISPALDSRLFPTALPLANALHRVLARVRAVALQRTSALAREALVTAGPVARMIEKIVLE
jgi:hypothetical protein